MTRPLAAVLLVASVWASGATGRASDERGAALINRLTPASGGFSLSPTSPPLVHPSGEFFFCIVANRLLCSVNTTTGDYIASFDFGLNLAARIAEQPIVPMSISEDGTVLAVPAAGAIRFFTVGVGGRLTVLSEFATPTGSPVQVGLTPNGKLAVFASGPGPSTVNTIKTASAELLNSIPLSIDETPLFNDYSPERRAISIITPKSVLIFRHNDAGKLSQTGMYLRIGFVGDTLSGLGAVGKRGRVIFTVEEGGSALIGLSLKGKQTTRVAADLPDRFSAPVAASPDGATIVATLVSGQTGLPKALYFFRGEGRKIKGNPTIVPLDASLGKFGQMLFDPTGELLTASFPQSGRVLLFDVGARQLVQTTSLVGSSFGLAFSRGGRNLLIVGSASSAPLSPIQSGGVTILPVTRRGFDEAGALRFERLPGALFGPGDKAFGFQNKSYAVATCGAADQIYTFNTASGGLIDLIDLGPSMGMLAVSPDRRTLVVSGGGGIVVFSINDEGHLTQKGGATPGAVPPEAAPNVAFDPDGRFAYVTAENAIWRVNLTTGASEAFELYAAGTQLSNPKVDAAGARLYAIKDSNDLVRCTLDANGRPTLIGTTTLDANLDSAAPIVAYDDSGSLMWFVSNGVLKQVKLFNGIVESSAQGRSIGRDTVLVAPGLLAVLPDGATPLAFFDTTGRTPTFLRELTLGAPVFSPSPGGTAAVNPATRTLYVPLTEARTILAIPDEGDPFVIDQTTGAAHLNLTTGPNQLVYPDLGAFPGSVVAARGF